jgi:hypothetical protein
VGDRGGAPYGRAMSGTTSADSLRAERLAAVDDSVARLGATPRPPQVHGLIDALRARLGHAHDRCASVPAQRWADYRTALDAGVDELDTELARVGEHHDPEELEELVYPHAARLELDAWRLRVDGGTTPADLVSFAHRELTAEGPVRRHDVERILVALRDSVPHSS